MTSHPNEITETQAEHSVVIPMHQAPSLPQNKISETQICLICYNDFPLSEIWTPLNCTHKFCTNCFQEHIESKIQAFQVLNIHCPQEGCKEIFTDAQIMKILDESEYNKFQELVLKKMAYKNSVAQVCPKPGCARPLAGFKDNGGEIVCICGTQICSKCLNFAHIGKSCLQAVDPEFELFAQDNDIRYCIICKTPVSRVEGCLHMTCCVCDYEWCWACGRQYSPKHVCTGTWSPSAPSIYAERTRIQKIGRSIKNSLIFVAKAILNIFILFPIFLIFTLIFWPMGFLTADRRRRRRMRKPSVCKMLGLFILSGLIGIILLPIVVTVGTIFLICSLPKLITRCKRRLAHRKKKQPKRWMAGNVANFKYTDAARPTANAVVNVNNDGLPNGIEENPLDLAPIRRIQSFLNLNDSS